MNKKPAKKKSAAQTRKKTVKRKERPSEDRSAKAAAPAPPAEESQFGGIMAKSLELAQASINLGLNLVQQFGTSFQGDLLNRIADAGKSVFAARESAAASQSAATAQPDSDTVRQEPGPASAGAITNRLPLFPGSAVHIPFSINNDAPGETKTVNLRIEGFAGELTGAGLKADHFSVVPASKEIAPMDFEKFVITGTLPINCRGDAYWGAIAVTGTESMKIPVKIVVMSRT